MTRHKIGDDDIQKQSAERLARHLNFKAQAYLTKHPMFGFYRTDARKFYRQKLYRHAPYHTRPIVRRVPDAGKAISHYKKVVRRWLVMNGGVATKGKLVSFTNQLEEVCWGRSFYHRRESSFYKLLELFHRIVKIARKKTHSEVVLTLYEYDFWNIADSKVRGNIAIKIGVPSRSVPIELIRAKKAHLVVTNLLKESI